MSTLDPRLPAEAPTWCELAVPALFLAGQVGRSGGAADGELLAASRAATRRWLSLPAPAEIAEEVAILRDASADAGEPDLVSRRRHAEAALASVIDHVERTCGFTTDDLFTAPVDHDPTDGAADPGAVSAADDAG